MGGANDTMEGGEWELHAEQRKWEPGRRGGREPHGLVHGRMRLGQEKQLKVSSFRAECVAAGVWGGSRGKKRAREGRGGVNSEQRKWHEWHVCERPLSVALLKCFGKESASSLKGNDGVGGSASSYSNMEEAELAVSVAKSLLAPGDIASVAILTPYNGQVMPFPSDLH